MKIKNKKEKLPLRLAFLVTITVCLILVASMLLAGIIMLILTKFFEDSGVPFFIVVYVFTICLMFAWIATRIVSDKIFIPMVKLNEAMKKVAEGDFTVRMNETGMFREVREMIRNFNIMAGELGANKIIHTDFTRNVSHEIKTPLSAIEGYATLLQNPEISEETRSEYCEKIIRSTRRLSNLSSNVLMLSKLENNTMTIPKKRFSLDEQLRQVVLMYEDIWTEKNIDIDIDDEDRHIDFYGSEELLFQAWQNLIGNALKFTPESGTVRIILRKTDATITVRIRDNGLGIPKEAQKRIFEKFYQGDHSHASNGNGLGLAITYQIVKLHSGEITVESEPEKGTEFTVILPEIA